MKRSSWIIGGCVIAALLATNGATYWQTREKWYGLGVTSGHISGQANAMEVLAPFATPGPLPKEFDFSISVKASMLVGKVIDRGVALYYVP